MKRLLTCVAGGVCLAWGLLRTPLRPPLGLALWPFKLLTGALTPALAALGAASAILGLALRAPWAVVLGGLGAWGLGRHWQAQTTDPDPVQAAFGPRWRAPATSPQKNRLRSWRRPEPSGPRVTRDVAFWCLPDSNRQLLGDIWQPAAGVHGSGLAVLYFHGSAWALFDKDVATRPFFRALTAHGHVVVDVAYRLAPEADLAGMVGDVKRAVAWIKREGAAYGVDPNRVVLAGGSAGGHLALLAAFAPAEPDLTPTDVIGQDLSVAGVVSFYGLSDLAACYAHTRQDQRSTDPTWRRTLSERVLGPLTRLADRVTGNLCRRLNLDHLLEAGLFPLVVGGTPTEQPERYRRYSPIHHVHAGCPPTLLIQGADDLITPLWATEVLADRLHAAGVPVGNLVLPGAEHGFDLLLPHISPPAQIAQRAVERFLSVLACNAGEAAPERTQPS